MKRVLITSLMALAAIQPAMGSTSTSNFNVTITILKQCAVVPPATMNFGTVSTIDATGTPLSATQAFSITCSSGTPYTIGFSSPNDLTPGSGVHQMKGTGTNTGAVQYNLYDSTNGGTVPLDASVHVISDTGTGAVQSKSLKAQVVNFTASILPDTYTDTVTMTVTY